MPVPSAVISVPISWLRQHAVEPRPLHVQDFALQRQDGLEFPVAPLLGGAAGAVALDDEDLAFRRVALLAVGQLAGQGGDIQHALAPGQFARLAGRLARRGRVHHLLDDRPWPPSDASRTNATRRRPPRPAPPAAPPRRPACPWSGRRISGPAPSPTAPRSCLRACPRRPVASWSFLPMPSAYLVTTRVSAWRKPARCVPPSRCGMLLVKHSIVSW